MADGIEVKVDTKNLKIVENVLSSMASRGQNIRTIMQKLGVQMVKIVNRNFEAEGRPTKWKKRSPLSEANLIVDAQNKKKKTKAYQKRKNKGRASILFKESMRARSTKILSSEKSTLKNSITCEASDTQVKVGAPESVPYARIHQLGGVIKPKSKNALFVPCGKRMLRLKSVKIPARPYLTVPQSEVPGLARIVIDGLQTQVRIRVLRGRNGN